MKDGIHTLASAELLRLTRALARADFSDPVSRAGLVLAKFGHLEQDLEAIVGHSKRAAIAIVGAILRERQRTATVRSSVVWSGPPPSGQGTRAPYELLSELIATATQSVLFTGACLERDARLLRALHAAQRGRSLSAVVVLAQHDPSAQQRADELFSEYRPWPELYQPDPTRVTGPLPQSLWVDRERGVLLAGSAPEVEAPDEIVTAGLLVEDPGTVVALYGQWQVLIEQGALLPLAAADLPTS